MHLNVKLEGKHELMFERIMATTSKNISDAVRAAIESYYDEITNHDRVTYNELQLMNLVLLELLCRIDSRLHVDTVFKTTGKSTDYETMMIKIKDASEKLYTDIVNNKLRGHNE